MKKIQLIILTFICYFLFSATLKAQDFTENNYLEGGLNTFVTTDFNEDGLPDLVGFNYKFTGVTDLEVLMNRSDTSIIFESVVLASSELFNGSPAVGDLDADGDIDIAVSLDMFNQILILRNNGDNTFAQETTTFAGVNKLTFIDLEGDGDMDLIGYKFNDNIISTFVNDGSGNLSEGTITQHTNEVSSVDYGDIDDDGDMDFVLSVDKFSGETVAIYLNDSLNNFSKLSSFDINALNSALQVKIVDINRDGKMDVLGLNDKKLVAFLQNDIFGFIDQELVSPSNSGDLSTFDIADFDGNGTLDLIIGDLTSNLYWYSNELLVFSQKEISGVKPVYVLHAEDFDMDGDVDFAVSNGDFRAYRNDIEQMPSSLAIIHKNEISMYPNPAANFFEVKAADEGNYKMSLFNMEGKVLKTKSFSNYLKVSMEGLESGLYSVQIYDAEKQSISIQKLTKI